MAPLSPEQVRMRMRVEGLIRVMAPALDLVLAAGERASRLVEREDVEYYPSSSSPGSAASRFPPPQPPSWPRFW